MAASTRSKTAEREQQAEGHAQERARMPAIAGPHASILGLQRAAGNRAVSQLVQPNRDGASFAGAVLQRKCASCAASGGECSHCKEREEQVLQRQMEGAATPITGNRVPPIVYTVLKSGNGQPLEPTTREFMESRFSYDFSQVRVHTDARAAESARAVNALAYTVGKNLVFGTGQYAPLTTGGKRLLAHELTHVVQQHGVEVTRQIPISPANGEAEHEAERNGSGIDKPLAKTSDPSLQRATDPNAAAKRTDFVVMTIPELSPECIEFCTRNPARSDMLTGTIVHAELKKWFAKVYGKPEDVQFSTGSKASLKDAPYTVGGPGYSDIAYLSKSLRVIEIAEVKAANLEELKKGAFELSHYLAKGNSDEALKREKDVTSFLPMEPWKFPLPRFLDILDPFLRVRRFHFMWCAPGIIVYKEIKRKKDKKEKEKEKVKEKDKVGGAEQSKQADEESKEPGQPQLPLQVNPEETTLEKYVDNFDSVYYDLDYRYTTSSKGTRASEIIRVVYPNGTVIEININDIADESLSGMGWYTAIDQGYIGSGGRFFPKGMNRTTTPRLWAAKREVLGIIGLDAVRQIKIAREAVMYILTMGIGMAAANSAISLRANVRPVSRSQPIQPIQKVGPPPRPPAPGPRMPRSRPSLPPPIPWRAPPPSIRPPAPL